jgi:non-lysosomal glucosylceramidase
MPYYAEVMTGFEYSAAILMLAYGMVDEGVECIGNIRRRYDGEKANPYNEAEAGRHYARAMASWGAVPMLSGFRYDARARRMELAPRINVDAFQCFWSAPGAWGNFELTPRKMVLTPAAGSISLRDLLIVPFSRSSEGNLKVTIAGRTIEHSAVSQGDGMVLQFSETVEVEPTKPLVVQA